MARVIKRTRKTITSETWTVSWTVTGAKGDATDDESPPAEVAPKPIELTGAGDASQHVDPVTKDNPANDVESDAAVETKAKDAATKQETETRH